MEKEQELEPTFAHYPGRCTGCLHDFTKSECGSCDPTAIKWGIRLPDDVLVRCNGELEDVMRLFDFNQQLFPDLPITLVNLEDENV